MSPAMVKQQFATEGKAHSRQRHIAPPQTRASLVARDGPTSRRSAADGGFRHQRISKHPDGIEPEEHEIDWKAQGGDHHRPPRHRRSAVRLQERPVGQRGWALSPWSLPRRTPPRSDVARRPVTEAGPAPASPAAPPCHRPPGPVPVRRSRPGSGPGRGAPAPRPGCWVPVLCTGSQRSLATDRCRHRRWPASLATDPRPPPARLEQLPAAGLP